MTSVELLRKIGADQLDNWTDTEIEDAIATLQGERRRRKRNAKPAAEVPAEPFEEPDDVAGRSWTSRNAELRVIG
jgi:hypothetical protein